MRKEKSVIEVEGKKVRLLDQHTTNPEYHTEKQQVFIVGSKGIPAAYGGFETFVEKLTEYQKSDKIRYHVARIADDTTRFEYNGAKCFNVKVPDIGAAKAIYYDCAALNTCIKYCKARPSIKKPIFYVLACRIGPFVRYYKRQIKKLGGTLYVNPDGHEWKRAKWSAPVRAYWKISEAGMIKHADLVICDSVNIEKYIRKDYAKYNPKTTYIAYGTEISASKLADNDETFVKWMKKQNIQPKEYYLIVGRFVPENNYETMIREFMQSNTKKKLVIITTPNGKLYDELNEKLGFETDSRIVFAGTVYDQELLKKIRENAYGYFHGHEVGGTNPSLLEALGSTELNLLLDVVFNKEVGQESALYWSRKSGNLAKLIDKTDKMSCDKVSTLGQQAKKRVAEVYTWEKICNQYEVLFEN